MKLKETYYDLFLKVDTISMSHDAKTAMFWSKYHRDAVQDNPFESNPSCTDRGTSSGGGGVMVWGSISLTGKTGFVIIGGYFSAERYQSEILQSVAVPHLHSLGPNSEQVHQSTSTI